MGRRGFTPEPCQNPFASARHLMQVGWMWLVTGTWRFLKEEKVYWITPMVVILLVLIVMILLMESKAVLPYEYTVP